MFQVHTVITVIQDTIIGYYVVECVIHVYTTIIIQTDIIIGYCVIIGQTIQAETTVGIRVGSVVDKCIIARSR